MGWFEAIGFVLVSSKYKNLLPVDCITASKCVIMMADKHTSETHCLSLKEKGKRHAQRKRLYTNRAFGSDCNYRIIDGHIDAGIAAGEETSADGNLPGESAPMDTYLVDDHHR
jgi:hypothetical protein